MNQYIQSVVSAVMSGDVVHAVKYISPSLVVRATRKRVGGKIDKRDDTIIILKIGRPNYVEREFIKTCKKAKESFPVRKIQFKLYHATHKT